MAGDTEEKQFQHAFDKGRYGLSRLDLERMGERSVRDALNSGKFGALGTEVFGFVSAWLADKEFGREEAYLRDFERNSKSSERNARISARFAIWSAIIALIAIAIGIKSSIFSPIFGAP